MTEDQLQAKIFQWTWNNYPQTRRLFFHIPNGGARNKIEAIKFKAIGVLPGVPDMLLIWKNTPYFFELKSLTGKVSNDQKKVHQVLLDNNIQVYVIRTEEQFQEIFKNIIGK